MKNTILLSGILLLTNNVFSQPPVEWIEHTGSKSGYSEPTRMVNDSEGNILILGDVSDSVDLDPGTGTFMVYNEYGEADFFIQKLSPNGELLWARDYGDTSQVVLIGLGTDQFNNVIIGGYFMGSIDFDPSTPEVDTSYNFLFDIVLIKLDPDGNSLWHKTYGDNHMDRSFRLAVDPDGNIFTVGTFGSVLMDFDPGTGTDYLSNPGGGANHDSFIQKFDPDGNHVWVRQLAGNDLMQALTITLDSDDNIIVGGRFGGGHDFDPGSGTVSISTGTYETFVLKLNADGWFKWVIPIFSMYAEIRDLATDKYGNCYVGGEFIYSLSSVENGSLVEVYGDPSSQNGFVIKLDSLGDTKWKSLINSAGNEVVQDLDTGPSNSIYLSGSFTEDLDFENGAGPITPFSSNDNFLLQLNADGETEWVQTVSGGIGARNCISNSETGELYFTCTFYDTIQYLPDYAQELFTDSAEGPNLVTIKFNSYLANEDATDDVLLLSNTELHVYPNPTSGLVNADLTEFSGEVLIQIYDVTGNLVLNEYVTSNLWLADLGLLQAGIYFLKVNDGVLFKTSVVSKY